MYKPEDEEDQKREEQSEDAEGRNGDEGSASDGNAAVGLHVFEENENGADAGAGDVAYELDGGVLVDERFDPGEIIEEIDDGDLERGSREAEIPRYRLGRPKSQ